MTGPDYAGALWIPADVSNFHAADRAAPTHVVVHITDGHGDARGTAQMFATPKDKRDPPVADSSHFVVGQDGLVVQCVLIKDIAWHAHSANVWSVGVEHCCRTPGVLGHDDPGLMPSDALYDASAKLVAWVCHEYGIVPTRAFILGHKEADPYTTHDDCPIGAWDWSEYMVRVAAAYAALAPAC